MNEMQYDENKIEYLQDKTQAPSNHAIWMANIKFPPPPAGKEAKQVI
jgi:hypothetical protein